MRRIAIVTATVVVAVLVIGQVALPPYLEHRVEQRLTKDGGQASVSLSAFPAYRLLFKEGSELKIRARGISTPFGPPGTTPVLKDLDGFGRVDIEITNSTAGPLKVTSFTLKREGSGPYSASVTGTITARDVGAFGGGAVGGPLGAFLGGLAGGSVPFGDQPIPVDLQASIASDNGVPSAQAVNGSVAGLPANALLEALAIALGARI